MESGINADILVCRTEHDISDDIKNKLALFCNVDVDSVIQSKDASTIYDVPLMMEKEQLDKVVLKKLQISNFGPTDMERLTEFVNKLKYPKSKVNRQSTQSKSMWWEGQNGRNKGAVLNSEA